MNMTICQVSKWNVVAAAIAVMMIAERAEIRCEGLVKDKSGPGA